jgi:hypothetical protein
MQMPGKAELYYIVLKQKIGSDLTGALTLVEELFSLLTLQI